MNSAHFASFFPDNLLLQTNRFRLRMLQPADAGPLFSLAGDPSLWTWFTRRLHIRDELDAWIGEALDHHRQQSRFPFVVQDLDSGGLCGSTSLGNISFQDKRVEIGWTWYGGSWRGSGINAHCKYLLLQYAFETLEFERVELKTDALNERSRAAMRKIGLVEEGVLRSHMSMPGGRRRDSVYYSLLPGEWPAVKEKLQTLMADQS